MSQTALFIERDGALCADDTLCPGVGAVLKRMNLANVPVVCFGGQTTPSASELIQHADPSLSLAADLMTTDPKLLPPRPGMILTVAAEMGLDVASSWLVAATHHAVKTAEQAGCYGAVLIGDGPEPEGFLAIRLKRARDLADAPRVMVPDDGGCWHDHR